MLHWLHRLQLHRWLMNGWCMLQWLWHWLHWLGHWLRHWLRHRLPSMNQTQGQCSTTTSRWWHSWLWRQVLHRDAAEDRRWSCLHRHVHLMRRHGSLWHWIAVRWSVRRHVHWHGLKWSSMRTHGVKCLKRHSMRTRHRHWCLWRIWLHIPILLVAVVQQCCLVFNLGTLDHLLKAQRLPLHICGSGNCWHRERSLIGAISRRRSGGSLKNTPSIARRRRHFRHT